MNIKKYLEKEAEKEAESLLTEEDKQFCLQLAKDYQSEEKEVVLKRPNVTLWSVLSAVVAVCITLAITLPLVLKNPSEKILHYQDENVKAEACLLEDVNDNSKYFQLSEMEGASYKLNYDSISNDKLYYNYTCTTLFSDIKIFVVVNEAYDFKFELEDKLYSENLSQFTLNYCIIESNSFTGTGMQFKGFIEINTEKVFIDYTQLVNLGEQAFFDDIQNIIKAK